MYRPCHLRRKVLITLALLLYLVFTTLSFRAAAAAENPILYLFWGDGCPHCEKEKVYLNVLREKYPELEMRWFETWSYPEFAQLADTMRQAYGLTRSSVPLTFIGNWSEIGYLSDEKTGLDIEKQIIACIQHECTDPLVKLGPQKIAWTIMDQARKKTPVGWEQFSATIPPRKELFPSTEAPTSLPTATPVSSSQPASENTSISSQPPSQPPENSSAQIEKLVQPTPISSSASKPQSGSKDDIVQLPWNIQVNVSKIGLPLFTIIIGGLDGFNPCAMWVLCFLLTLVIYAKSRARILLIGGIFVLASGFIYFLFMIAWLNIYKLVGYIKVLTKVIGFVAIVIGLINCKDFFFFKKGISLTIPESAQPKLFKQMRNIINTSALPGVILGTIVLAVTVNLFELLCTAGLPAIYTGILEMQAFSKFQEYAYLVLYNVIYVIPLVVIVSVFAWKMGGRKLTEKEGRILKLVSGVLMLTLGIILLVKPQILMFG